MTSKEKVKKGAELEVTFLELFHGSKRCNSETASGRSDTSTLRNELTLYISMDRKCLIAVCHTTIQITLRFSFILMS